MAATVLSGSSNVTYTNSTGQNVRVIINYMRGLTQTSGSSSTTSISMSWATGGSASGQVLAIGRNLAFTAGVFFAGTSANSTAMNSNNACPVVSQTSTSSSISIPETALPTEIMLATGQTFSATCSAYNIVIIPEAG